MLQRPEKGLSQIVARRFAQEAKTFAGWQFGQPTRQEELPAIVAALTGEMAFAASDFASSKVRESAFSRLRDLLRRERKKSRAGHAGYDFNRHLALHQVLASLGGRLPEHETGKSAS